MGYPSSAQHFGQVGCTGASTYKPARQSLVLSSQILSVVLSLGIQSHAEREQLISVQIRKAIKEKSYQVLDGKGIGACSPSFPFPRALFLVSPMLPLPMPPSEEHWLWAPS